MCEMEARRRLLKFLPFAEHVYRFASFGTRIVSCFETTREVSDLTPNDLYKIL